MYLNETITRREDIPICNDQDELALLDATSTHGTGKSKQTRSEGKIRKGIQRGRKGTEYVDRKEMQYVDW
jgi:hypothetical protein